MRLRIVEPLPKLRRRRPQYLPMPKHDASRTEWLRWRRASGVEEKFDEYNVEDDLAEYAAQGSPTWLAALLVISAFLFGGLAFALVERWLRS